MTRKNILLFFIILIAIVMRFFNLGINPPSLTWDEVAWGYNAYSLGIDGKDEFGRFLPLDYLESFGDFKPPVYAYLDILPVKIFGLTEFAVRFPSALFGALTVLLSYFLVLRIFKTSHHREWYALAAAFILSISPWHILLSRAAFEANVATFWLVLGIFAYICAVQDRPRFMIISAISFVLSLYTFNTSRVFAPLIIIALTLIFWKKLWRIKGTTFLALVIGVALMLPSMHFLFSAQARLRYQEVNIFSDVNLVKTANQEVENDGGVWWSKILHNRRVVFAREYMKHYFDNLSPEFLFVKGDGNIKFSTQDVGQMYLWELPFLVIGGFLLFKKREGYWFVIPIWLLLGIIPAATARETPHALRIETILPTLQVIVAYGFVNSAFYLKKYFRVFAGIAGAVVVFSVFYFWHAYFVENPWEFSSEWQYGYKESIEYVGSVAKNYDRVEVTDVLGRPYIYYLFYLKVPPQEFRKTAVVRRDVFGFVSVDKFLKYEFNKSTSIGNNKKVLYVVSALEKLPSGVKPLKIFYNVKGDAVMQAFSL